MVSILIALSHQAEAATYLIHRERVMRRNLLVSSCLSSNYRLTNCLSMITRMVRTPEVPSWFDEIVDSKGLTIVRVG